ncbi:hypothetical protein [Sphingomonas sp. KR3-1]|uniref:hypothetical protein n=1 Tax=Sphingomonas sp. KR3-1 TaxID=3156611 RepID=UPI0032B5A44D
MYNLRSDQLYSVEIFRSRVTLIRKKNELSYTAILATLMIIGTSIVVNLLRHATFDDVRYAAYSYATFWILLAILQFADRKNAAGVAKDAHVEELGHGFSLLIVSLAGLNLLIAAAILALSL